MSIDARVKEVIRNQDGSGELRLAHRPVTYAGGAPGDAGQGVLTFDSAPPDIDSLIGQDIWGGDNNIILGRERRIANRIGYTKIKFIVDRIGA